VNREEIVKICNDEGVDNLEQMKALLKEKYIGKFISFEGYALHSRGWYYGSDQEFQLVYINTPYGYVAVSSSFEKDTPEYSNWNETPENCHCVVEGIVDGVTVGPPTVFNDRPEEWTFKADETNVNFRLVSVSAFSPISEIEGKQK